MNTPIVRGFITIIVIVALQGCTPTFLTVTKAEITPVFLGQAPNNLNIAVVDHRSFVLSGDKEEWFEGMVRGAYFITFPYGRPGDDGKLSEQPFALYLSSVLADSMIAVGANVKMVQITKGTDIKEAIRQSSTENNAPSIILLINSSRYLIGGYRAEYEHSFDVFVVNQGGEILENKTFGRFDEDLPSFKEYYVHDFYSLIYKKVLDEILNDREVAAAIALASTS